MWVSPAFTTGSKVHTRNSSHLKLSPKSSIAKACPHAALSKANIIPAPSFKISEIGLGHGKTETKNRKMKKELLPSRNPPKSCLPPSGWPRQTAQSSSWPKCTLRNPTLVTYQRARCPQPRCRSPGPDPSVPASSPSWHPSSGRSALRRRFLMEEMMMMMMMMMMVMTEKSPTWT